MCLQFIGDGEPCGCELTEAEAHRAAQRHRAAVHLCELRRGRDNMRLNKIASGSYSFILQILGAAEAYRAVGISTAGK